jgi:hypothetical protein
LRLIDTLNAGAEIELTLPLQIPELPIKYSFTGLFRFEDGAKKMPFGEELVLLITVANDHEDDESEEQQMVYQQLAMDLTDRGFGNFEVCF